MLRLYTVTKVPVDLIAAQFGVSRRTVYNAIDRATKNPPAPDTGETGEKPGVHATQLGPSVPPT